VAEATARQIANDPAANPDWEQGYGYQFWRCRHGAYRGDGAFGQFCLVMPDQEAVLAITAGTADMQRVLDLVWEHLLPAMAPAPLPDDRAAHDALTARLAGLRLLPPRGQHGAALAAQISGRTFAIAANDDRIQTITFSFTDDGCDLTLHHAWGMQGIRCGHDTWVRSVVPTERGDLARVAAGGAWLDECTYVARLWWYETPFARTLTCHFAQDQLLLDQQINVSFGPTDRPRLEGRPVQPA
jgi:hypothetical protein